jgi:hypothetical protein
MMVILRANQEFMRQSRKKYPEAIKKLGHLFGVPTVDVEVEEEEEDLAGADASAKKRAKLDKENLPAQKQAKLRFTASLYRRPLSSDASVRLG